VSFICGRYWVYVLMSICAAFVHIPIKIVNKEIAKWGKLALGALKLIGSVSRIEVILSLKRTNIFFTQTEICTK